MTSDPTPIPDDVVLRIREALATWDREEAAKKVAEAERSRIEFVDLFPLDIWPTMPLERYALGQTYEGGTASWWLEFNTRHVASMSGGSAGKHLIFLSGNEWYYPKRYQSAEEAWESVRAGFVEVFSLAERGEIDAIRNVEAFYGAPALRTKAIYMYFPDLVIPVCSFTHVHHFLDVLAQDYDANWVLGSNVKLLRTLRTFPELTAMSTQELMLFLYHWADPRSAKQVVKIAPGERASYWDDCLANGYVCVSWDEVGDLSLFANKDEFRQEFGRHFPYNGHRATISRKANELWTLMTLEPGDKVIANRGTSEILAVGTVNETGYRYLTDRDEYRHTLGVDWDTSFARSVDPIGAWATSTVSKVNIAQYRKLFGESTSVGSTADVAVDDVYSDIEQAFLRRGQVVLYGPPGTGKTYIARRAAVWFHERGNSAESASSLLADDDLLYGREQALAETPLLTRVTFHPSYTYEDFVEGFRPTQNSNGGLELTLVDGIFKRVCAAARAEPGSRFILLIDELNRGNIAKIFGELITLIEHDKRGLTVRLPQSGDEFSVPSNVYIIATMNTADRSIQLLDTALRRRFRFIELMPDGETLEGIDIAGLSLRDFLDHLNEAIRERVGRERQIGHAMFFQGASPVSTPEAFVEIFRHELLPMVQEYLYDSYADLAEVFGSNVVDPDRERVTALLEDPMTLCSLLADQFDAGLS